MVRGDSRPIVVDNQYGIATVLGEGDRDRPAGVARGIVQEVPHEPGELVPITVDLGGGDAAGVDIDAT